MRIIPLVLTAVVLLASVWFGGAARLADDGEVTIELVDSATGRNLPGIIRVMNDQQQVVPLPGLMNRGLGIEAAGPIHDWHVLPAKSTVRLPAGRYTVHGLQGVETEQGEAAMVVERGGRHSVRVPLVRFYDSAARGKRSGNTHLHLQKLPRVEADRYLTDVPKVDGLDLLFVSFLERIDADREYITNEYTRDDLRRLGDRGVPIANGEEYRHNFTGWGEGYGHVMFLDLPRLIRPASFGVGIMKTGSDGQTLRDGIDNARQQGSTIIWCHDQWGYEDIPNWVMGRLQANNIFDGGTHGSYQHSFYRYLNAGLKTPFSTGTDWFQYDFSRVYIPATTAPTAQDFLKRVAEGRTMITNGPLLELRIEGREIGETLDLPRGGKVVVEAKGLGRVDFGRIELVKNGAVIEQVQCAPEVRHYAASARWEVNLADPCWLALRTPPPPVKKFPELNPPVKQNELGNDLFAHTSAIFVDIAGRHVFDLPTAESLLAEMQENRRLIAAKADFSNDTERLRVLNVHDEAIAEWTQRIKDNRKNAKPQ